MAETIAFRAATRARILEEVVRRLAPQRARVFLEGAVRDLAGEVVLRVSSGRVIEVRTGGLEGARALMRVLLADAGRIELHADDPPGMAIESFPRFEAVYAEAEAAVNALLGALAYAGGLAAIPVADLDQLMVQLAALPDAASAVLRLADGQRTIAAILRDAPFDEVLTARILERLFAVGILGLAGSAPSAITATPEPVPPLASADDFEPARTFVRTPAGGEVPPDIASVLPSEDELEGRGVDEDIARWLENEMIPEPLLSEDSFSRAFTTQEMYAMTGSAPPPVTQAPAEVLPHPEPVRSDAPSTAPTIGAAIESARARFHAAETEDLESAAEEIGDDDIESERLTNEGAPPPNRSVLAGALAALVAIALLMGVFAQRGSKKDEEPREEDARVEAPPRPIVTPPLVVKTATTSTASQAAKDTLHELARVAPPIAGPDAPEDVKKAEQLLNAGSYWEAGKLLTHLRETRPRDPAVWVLSGQHYVDSGGRLQLALEAADRAIEIDPKFYRAWVLKGSAMQFLGRRDKAAEAYNKALAIDPAHPMSDEIRAVTGQLERPR